MARERIQVHYAFALKDGNPGGRSNWIQSTMDVLMRIGDIVVTNSVENIVDGYCFCDANGRAILDWPNLQCDRDYLTLYRPVPETALVAMIGRPLRDLIDIPGFKVLDVPLKSYCVMGTGGEIIELRIS